MISPSPQTQLLDKLCLPALLVSAGRVEFANPAAMQLLGSHIIGEDVRIALRHPNAVALLSGTDDGRTQLEGLSVAGSLWELSVHRLDSRQMLATLTDLSVQTSVARAHADFVANASHELRTPLASILGYVETLEDPKAGGDDATRSRFLDVVKREARRMQALVDDLMSLSRIEANKHDVPDGITDLIKIARQVAAEQDRAKIELHSNAANAMVQGDEAQLAQLLRNLIENAIKYGAPDGMVLVEIDVTPTGWVSVAIKDEGEGISPEHLPRLTERFYRVDAGRSRAAGGTGLGLSIVKHIVERHRGRFDLSSRAGRGTTASFILPLAGS